MTMTDLWCFTCDHEIRQTIDGTYEHVREDETEDCTCTEGELNCEPR